LQRFSFFASLLLMSCRPAALEKGELLVDAGAGDRENILGLLEKRTGFWDFIFYG